jgi:hypothetical protein
MPSQAPSHLARPAADSVSLQTPTLEEENLAASTYMLAEEGADWREYLNHFDIEWANHFGNSS